MSMHFFDSELRVMELLWKEGDMTAKELSVRLGEDVGWNKNTTYSIIKKCVQKGAIQRSEPHFLCHALVSREEAQAQEVEELVSKWFDGSDSLLFSALTSRRELPDELANALRDFLDKEMGEPE